MKRFLLAAAGLFAVLSLAAAPKILSIPSPDGKVVAAVDYSGPLTYSIGYNSILLLVDCPAQMRLESDKFFGKGRVTDVTTRRNVDNVIETVVYHKSTVRDRFNEATFHYKDHDVIFRVYNDGVAYRFVSHAKKEITVLNEVFTLNLADNWPMYVSYVRSESPSRKNWEPQFNTSFENYYRKITPFDWDHDRLAFLPLLIEGPSGIRICITESDVMNYPAMYLYNGEKKKAQLTGVFATHPIILNQGGHHNLEVVAIGKEKWLGQYEGTTEFPWRVIAITPNDALMADNDIVFRLATPSNPTLDFSWVKPGKAVWDAWSGRNLYGVDFVTGVNDKTYRRYIDFAAENHLEYVVIDEGWAASKGEDLFHSVPEVDIPGLVEYAKQKGVGIILWTGAWPFLKDLDKVCRHYSEMGVKGFKVDYLHRDDKLMMNFLYEAAATAAKYRLVLDFHGISKPAGINRTWPNVLNFEGIYGQEYLKWDKDCDRVTYDVTVPFIRLVAGPADYAPGAMRNATRENFAAFRDEPMSQGTRCRQMAEYVVFTAPLAMLCDSPVNYEENRECLDFITRIPTVWEKTQVLGGQVGQFIVTARRSGDVWYIAALNNWEPRDLKVDLSFFKGEDCQVEIFSDGLNADRLARDYVHTFTTTAETPSQTIHMAPGGGFIARILRKPKAVQEASL